jgi:hypothetical protein
LQIALAALGAPLTIAAPAPSVATVALLVERAPALALVSRLEPVAVRVPGLAVVAVPGTTGGAVLARR